MTAPFKPAASACRAAMLGLSDPAEPSREPPKDGTTADLLAWALIPPGAEDPVEGLLDSVRVDLEALAEMHERCHPAFFLRRADGRDPSPIDDPEETQDAAPEEKPS